MSKSINSKRKLADFRPQRRNANRGRQAGLAQLDKSLRRDGYSAPMVAAADGEVFAGSKRLERAADVFGADVEPIVVHSDGTRPVIHVRDDIATADDPRAVRLGVADNLIAAIDHNPDGEMLALIAAEDAAIAEMVRADGLSAKAILSGPDAPDGFKEFGDDIETAYCCPKCGYRWSGKPNQE